MPQKEGRGLAGPIVTLDSAPRKRRTQKLASDEVLCELAADDARCASAINQLAAGSLGGLVLARLRRLTGFDEERASDLAQETWLLVWKARGTWAPKSGGAAVQFVLSVAHNAFLGATRSDNRRRARIEAFHQEAGNETTDPELAVDLTAALYRLGVQDRDLLLSAYQHGRSDREIAAILGITPAATKKRRQAALRRLRAVYTSPAFP
jgi:RNA polymerase sigma-70 factor, ECF subfamily